MRTIEGTRKVKNLETMRLNILLPETLSRNEKAVKEFYKASKEKDVIFILLKKKRLKICQLVERKDGRTERRELEGAKKTR